jgi:dATP pyrophosphohydrolase
LQLLRAGDPLRNTWQPVMGHVEAGETAARAALRELEEETGLSRRAPALLGFWALEQVSPFYVAALDAVVLSPRFAVRVAPAWSPVICPEHESFRWARGDDAAAFMWPGQRTAVREILDEILGTGTGTGPGPAAAALRLDVDVV